MTSAARYGVALGVAVLVAAGCGGNSSSDGTGSSGGNGGTAGSGGGSGGSGGGSGGSGGGGNACAAQDARSDGSKCALLAGVAFDGTQCVEIICGCEGSDCDELFGTVEQCEASCLGSGVSCGPKTCARGQVCCNESCGVCTKPGGACPAIGCEPEPDGGTGVELCGHVICAPGLECCNESCGTCIAPGGGCTDILCEPNCEAMDAVGVGPCDLELGYVWDGDSCDSISGCDCAGQDCGWVYPSPEVCAEARAMCPGDL